jgi:hypothetical protein
VRGAVVHEFIAVGEYGMATEVAVALAREKIAITDQELGDRLALAART